MYQILRKDFELPIKIKEKHILKYKQASMYECIEFSYEINQEWFNINERILKFLNKNWVKIKKTELVFIDLQKLIDVIFDTRYRGFFWKDKKESNYPLEAYFQFLGQKLSLDPLSVIKKYTPEQIKYLVDWIIYNINEQSKEWQRKNKIRAKFKKMEEDSSAKNDLAEIKKMEEEKNKKHIEKLKNLKSKK